MHPIYAMLILLIIIIAFSLAAIVSAILLIIYIKKNRNFKKPLISLCVCLVTVAITVLFIASHDTHYKFNDWYVLGNDIETIRETYGQFDIYQARRAGYYIYTDNGPVMPDHLEHYYFMYYDENGIIYSVDDGVQPGG